MGASMQVKLVQQGPVRFVATNPAGASIVVDGPEDMGGVNAGLRPMETLLAALASCSALDVIHIMNKQRQELERLEVEVNGERADAIPAVFTSIHMRFTGYGAIDAAKLQKAAELSIEKYCSVAKMLEPTVQISFDVRCGQRPIESPGELGYID